MPHISLKTEKCIVTGEPANVYTGHVIAYHSNDDVNVSVLAGFKDVATSETTKSSFGGCFGEWKPEHGIAVDIY